MYNKPPTSLEAGIALKKLDAAIRVPKPSGGYVYANMDRVTSERCAAMKACLNHYLDPKSKGFIDASERAVRGQSQGSTHARSIRRWICQFIKSGDLPKNKNGWWNVSTLEDKDVSSEIKLHLQQVGKFARAKDVVDFLRNPNTHARLKIVKKISIRTVQRWLSRAGYRWRTEPKGQYFDGHECEDVVAYCQSIFIPFWRALERRRIIFNEEGIPDPWRPMMLLPGEKPVIFWFHDESIFYANNRRLVQWVYIGEHPKPFKKGEGCSVMADDFFCPEWGWLRGLNG
ncbi:hypothetical protein B0J17DRAFT_236894 [Rhizoctonia solani]|nr:hypothetical protein B0J17DRAFT_236894 [Rhizoctonia solani]